MCPATGRFFLISQVRWWAGFLLGVLLLDPRVPSVLAGSDSAACPAGTPQAKPTSQTQVEIDILLVKVQGRLARQFAKYLREHSSEAGGCESKPQGLFSSLLGGEATTDISSGHIFTLNSPRNTKAIRAFVEELEKQGRAKIMAEPRLVTLSGHQASFLDGGEQAIPVVKESGQVGTQFEEYGTRISCLAKVLENGKIYLEVEPELSALDSASGTTVGGTVVPGRVTQRVRTTVEIEDGQTLVLGGMVQHQVLATEERDPVLGEMPWIGAAFTTKTFKEVETESLFILTAHLIPDSQPAGGDHAQPQGVATRLEQAERQLKKLQKEIDDLHRVLRSRQQHDPAAQHKE